MIYGKAAVFLGHKASLLSNWMDDIRFYRVIKTQVPIYTQLNWNDITSLC